MLQARLTAVADLPDGEETRETLKFMRDLVREYKRNDVIRQTAARLVQDLPQKAFLREVQCVFEFVLHDIRYLYDPTEIELIQSPVQVLEAQSGDCDDKCTLLASLLESIGHKTRFIAIGYEPCRFNHVFCETLTHGAGGSRKWTALDPTELNRPFGWRPVGALEVMVMAN